MIKRLFVFIAVFALVFAASAFTVFADENVTVYYYNSDGWDEVAAYTWEPSEQFGGWPGELCADEGDGWFSIVFPVYNIYGPVIFNNNGEGEQNSDLFFEADKLYFYGSRDSDEGMLTYDEAVAMFGSAPGAAEVAVVVETVVETAAEDNPKTGEGVALPVAGSALIISLSALLFLNRKQKAEANA